MQLRIQSESILNYSYKGLDAGVQLLCGTGQLALGRTIAVAGAATGNPTAISGGAYLLTAGVANIQGAGKKYFNIAVNEDFLPTDNFLQSAYENAAQAAGLSPKVGTAAYNLAELGTGIYGEFSPVKIANDYQYGLTITGPKYTLPIFQEFQESKAIATNAVLGLVKGGYDAWDSVQSASTGAAGGYLLYPNKPNTNQIQQVYKKN